MRMVVDCEEDIDKFGRYRVWDDETLSLSQEFGVGLLRSGVSVRSRDEPLSDDFQYKGKDFQMVVVDGGRCLALEHWNRTLLARRECPINYIAISDGRVTIKYTDAETLLMDSDDGVEVSDKGTIWLFQEENIRRVTRSSIFNSLREGVLDEITSGTGND